MTLEEKASLTSGLSFWHTKAVERLGVESMMLTDGPHGLRKQRGSADHAGLGDSVPATCFPTAATLGSTWDPDLLERVGEALGTETRAEGVAVLLGPGANMKRSPLCGRNFEYFSEDPLVAGEAAAALISGIQSTGVGASLKHFAANNQETDRLRVSADVDERTLREIYLPAFERAVRQADPWTVMCSYNRINGVHASEHRWLLTDVLRDEWGYTGLVMSDWGAVVRRVPGLVAGLDLEMPGSGGVTDAQVVAAVRSGEIDEAVLDRAAVRMVVLALRTRPALADPGTSDADAHHALAREAAAAGAVLLRNGTREGAPALPLDAGAFSADSPLAVIGEFARTPRYQGAGSSQIHPTRLDPALDALREDLGEDAVVFEPGFSLAEAAGLPGQGLPDDQLRSRAVEASRGRTAVVFIGLPASAESEGYDRTSIDLPADQVRLVHEVAGAAARTVVVLSNGSAVRVSDWEDEVDAVLECWLGGQAGGSAVAGMLLGRLAPSGHLAESLPRALADVPAQLNFPGEAGHVRYGEGVFIGYRGLDAMDAEVSHPFGFGLTYTTFEVGDVTVGGVTVGGPTGDGPAPDGPVTITASTPVDGEVALVGATVTNTGARRGAQVVQVYVGRRGPSAVARAPRELRAFAKVDLEPGATARVELPLTRRDLSHWDVATHSWTVEPGTWEISVGTSSRDLVATVAVEVDAPELRRPLDAESTLGEWLADPVGGPLARSVADEGALDALLDDTQLAPMFLSIPLGRMVRMPGQPLSPDGFEEILAQVTAGPAGVRRP